MEGRRVSVMPLPHLPASFYTAQELELLKPQDVHGDTYMNAMFAAVTAMLRGLGITKGQIYAGFGIGATSAKERQWSRDEINVGFEMPLYIMPWVEQPLNLLNPNALANAQAMLRGDFHRSPTGRWTLFKR